VTGRAPYMFGEAVTTSNGLDARQKAAEDETKRAYGTYAEAERAYRMALAAEITRQRANGVAATIAADLARGDRHVAGLRYRRDVAEGLVEAAKQSGWRHQANRKDGHELLRWSANRDLAEGYHGAAEPHRFDNVTPERAA
jgi:hypothetical protein